MARNIARMLVSWELINQGLHLPPGIELRAIKMGEYDRTVEMTVEGYDIPPVADEAEIPLRTPTVHYSFDWE